MKGKCKGCEWLQTDLAITIKEHTHRHESGEEDVQAMKIINWSSC